MFFVKGGTAESQIHQVRIQKQCRITNKRLDVQPEQVCSPLPGNRWGQGSGRIPEGTTGGWRRGAGGDTAGSTAQMNNEMRWSIMEEIRHLQPFLLVAGCRLIFRRRVSRDNVEGKSLSVASSCWDHHWEEPEDLWWKSTGTINLRLCS